MSSSAHYGPLLPPVYPSDYQNSLGYLPAHHLRVRNPAIAPSRTTSASTSNSVENSINSERASDASSNKSSKSVHKRPSKPRGRPSFGREQVPLGIVDLNAVPEEVSSPSSEDRPTLKEFVDEQLAHEAHEARSSSSESTRSHHSSSIVITHITANPDTVVRPFGRWISTIRRKKSKRKGALIPREERWSLDDDGEISRTISPPLPSNKHKKSSSWASSGFVTGLKSISLSARASNDTRQGYKGGSTHRDSFETTQEPRLDEAAWKRAMQRRRILEEILSSEENYVQDLRVLLNVFALPTC